MILPLPQIHYFQSADHCGDKRKPDKICVHRFLLLLFAQIVSEQFKCVLLPNWWTHINYYTYYTVLYLVLPLFSLPPQPQWASCKSHSLKYRFVLWLHKQFIQENLWHSPVFSWIQPSSWVMQNSHESAWLLWLMTWQFNVRFTGLFQHSSLYNSLTIWPFVLVSLQD